MITSRQNDRIKEVKSLTQKKYRDQKGLYIVEGVKMVAEAIDKGLSVQTIFATEKGYAQLLDRVNTDLEVQLVSDSVFDAISDEVTPQGVIATVNKPQNTYFVADKSCLLLDGVSDPKNVGAIIRTAAASGYTEIYTLNCADAYSQKSVRASMSGIFAVNIYSLEDISELSKIKLPLVIADMDGENAFDSDIKESFCLVIGNEGHGVSQQVKKMAKYTVSIPMQNDMESLNASVSAGILMYALKSKIKE